MNINVVNRSLRALGTRLNRMIAAAESGRTESSSHKGIERELKKYSSWPISLRPALCSQRTLEPRQVDVRVIEAFVTRVLPGELSQRLLISSRLPLNNYAWQSQDLKKTMALRNLQNLLNETILEIKHIEHRYIARSRG